MKRVTKNNMLKYIDMKKEYENTKNINLLKEINVFTDNVINKDKHYYKKISNYNFSNDQLKYCI